MMKIFCIAIVVAASLVSTAKCENWIQTGSYQSVDTFIDVESLIKEGSMVVYATSSNYKNAKTLVDKKLGPFSYLSDKSIYEANCSENRKRLVLGIVYAEQNRKGLNVIAFAGETAWTIPNRGSLGEYEMELACK